jgi:hypothetical protein
MITVTTREAMSNGIVATMIKADGGIRNNMAATKIWMAIRDKLPQTKAADLRRKTNTTRKRHTVTRITNNRPHRIRVEDHLLNSDKTPTIDQWEGEMVPH